MRYPQSGAQKSTLVAKRLKEWHKKSTRFSLAVKTGIERYFQSAKRKPTAPFQTGLKKTDRSKRCVKMILSELTGFAGLLNAF
jgi:hypothetical protein